MLPDLRRETHRHVKLGWRDMKIARLVGRQMLERGFNDLARKFPRLPDAKPADGITGKTNFDRSLG